MCDAGRRFVFVGVGAFGGVDGGDFALVVAGDGLGGIELFEFDGGVEWWWGGFGVDSADEDVEIEVSLFW